MNNIVDIKLINGDLIVESINEDGIKLYDVSPQTVEESVHEILRRAVETPLGYIEEVIIEDGSIKYIDSNFGNEIYKDLSEGITPTLIRKLNIHINNALDIVRPISNLLIEEVSVYTNPYVQGEIEINILYSIDSEIYPLNTSIRI